MSFRVGLVIHIFIYIAWLILLGKRNFSELLVAPILAWRGVAASNYSNSSSTWTFYLFGGIIKLIYAKDRIYITDFNILN